VRSLAAPPSRTCATPGPHCPPTWQEHFACCSECLTLKQTYMAYMTQVLRKERPTSHTSNPAPTCCRPPPLAHLPGLSAGHDTLDLPR
jgi:hypothetical protein